MRVSANGIAIEVDDQGLPGGEPLLLIMGLGMQLVGWPDEMVQLLVSRGFRVVRLDNRDAGLSQGFDELGVPHMMPVMLRYAMHLPVPAPYGIADMADDALGVLDALGITRAHVCGASMGGMIAQHLAARHPARVKSLTLMMSSSGARGLPQPSLKVRRALLSRPDGSDSAAVVEHLQRLLTLIGSPAYPADPERLRARLQATVQRAWRPKGTARQIVAVVAAGHDLVAKIRGAVADIVPGMGHDLPLQLLPHFVEGIADNAARG